MKYQIGRDSLLTLDFAVSRTRNSLEAQNGQYTQGEWWLLYDVSEASFVSIIRVPVSFRLLHGCIATGNTHNFENQTLVFSIVGGRLDEISQE